VCVAGRWTYLYRAVDSWGTTIDFYLSEQRDAAAVRQFPAAPRVTEKGLRAIVHEELKRSACQLKAGQWRFAARLEKFGLIDTLSFDKIMPKCFPRSANLIEYPWEEARHG